MAGEWTNSVQGQSQISQSVQEGAPIISQSARLGPGHSEVVAKQIKTVIPKEIRTDKVVKGVITEVKQTPYERRSQQTHRTQLVSTKLVDVRNDDDHNDAGH